jgi:outer membrane protein OmpA-like peptidoglycan-associated protein
MLKIIIICTSIMASILNAGMIESEIGIDVGLNSTKNEDGNKFKNPTIGVSYQDNKYVISPRLDIDYTKVNNDYASSLVKVSVNGVYEYENNTYAIPYALAGVGYEYVSGGTKDVFESNAFVQGGAGVRVDLEQGFKARVEGKVLKIVGGNDEGNEFIVTAGVSMPLSRFINKPVKRVVRPRVIIRQAQPIQQPIRVINNDMNECPLKISAPDLDRDGVPNTIDQCPATPCNFTVDGYGCPVKRTLKIHFASNSAQIESRSLFKIDNFSDFLMKNKGSYIRIVGHTDSAGSASHNLSLSHKRANSVVQALVERGVSPARLQADGKGESMPISSNQTAEGKAINRRIEAELTYPKGRR